MEQAIYNSILFKELSPWADKNCNPNSFSDKVRYLGGGFPPDSQYLFTHLEKLLSDYPSLISFKDNFLKPSKDKLFEPLLEFIIPPHFNAATEFYAELIKVESIRILNNVIAAVNESDNSIDKHYWANIAWKNIRNIAVIASEELNRNGFTDIPQYKYSQNISSIELFDRNTHYVLYLLKQYSIRLFFEFQILFLDHLQTIETHDQFYLYTLKESIPVASPLAFTSHYYHIEAKKIITGKSNNVESVSILLEEVIKVFPQPSNLTIDIIVALENYMFLNQFNIKSKNSDFESLATSAKSNDLYDKTKKLISNELKNKVYGHQRMEIIQDKMELLSNLNLNPDPVIPTNKLSAPRRLKEWLKQQENIYITNLNTVFSPEPDSNEELRKNPKPLSKRTKAELNAQKAKATELLNFMSGVNIYNVNIIADQDFSRLLRYTHELIEFEKVPRGIIQIPKINISNIMIRYTFYLIHQAIHGTTRIKDVYIDFLHEVFFQFRDVQKSTTKTKFSTKPASYKSDMDKMLG